MKKKGIQQQIDLILHVMQWTVVEREREAPASSQQNQS